MLIKYREMQHTHGPTKYGRCIAAGGGEKNPNPIEEPIVPPADKSVAIPGKSFSYFLKEADTARAQYDKEIPNGHPRIQTSGEGLLCRYRAPIESFKAQFPALVALTETELETIRISKDMLKWGKELGLLEDNNFSIDLLEKIVQEWALSFHHGMHFRLGLYEQNNGFTRLLLAPDEYAHVLWICGIVGPDGGHYEGIASSQQSITLEWILLLL